MIGSTNSLHAYQANIIEQSSKSKKLEEIQETHKATQAIQFTQMMAEVQSVIETKTQEDNFELEYQRFQDFLEEVGYEGKAIASLSQEEAIELVSKEGFFGVKQTSERIADFVISAAGSDEELLRQGRKGIIQGFQEAEKMWGGKLPDISYETIDKAVAMIDKALTDGGFSVLDEKV